MNLFRLGRTAGVIAFIMAIVTSWSNIAFAQNDSYLISGEMRNLNGRVCVAFNPQFNYGLVVWSQGERGNNESGRIYAADVVRLVDGSFDMREPFLVSPAEGAHNRPRVVYVPTLRKYVIAWDTGRYDPRQMLDTESVAAQAGSVILVRTYNQFSSTDSVDPVDGLGPIEPVGKNDGTINLAPLMVVVPTGEEAEFAEVLMIWTAVLPSASAPGLEVTGSENGAHMAVYPSPEDENAIGGQTDIDFLDKGRYSWGDTGAGFPGDMLYLDDSLYVYGAEFVESSNGTSLVPAVYRLDPVDFTVDDSIPLSGKMSVNFLSLTEDIHERFTADLDVLNQIDGANEGLRFAVVNTLEPGIHTIDGDFTEKSLRSIATVAKQNEKVLDIRLFRHNKNEGSSVAVKRSDLYVLYVNDNGQFRYRNLTERGKARGSAKYILNIDPEELMHFDVVVLGEEGVLVTAQRKNKNRSEIHLTSFTIE
jgi:hypothetical protein